MSEVYDRDSLFIAYLKWHYTRGLQELLGVSKNFLWFISHFFSFKLLLKTLFAPWRRMGESYGNILSNFENFASAFVVNSMMRAVGFISKIIVISIGLTTYFAVLVFSLFVFIIWFLAPVVVVGSAVLSATFFAI